jgi:hypothetical protein
MKTTTYLLAGLYAGIGLAQYSELTKSQELALIAEGLPVPGSGITVVPRSQLHLSKKEEDYFAARSAQQLQKGFISEYNTRAKELLSLHQTIQYHYEKYKNDTNPYSTSLKHTIAEIPMAYASTPVSANNIKIIGFSPMGTYIKDQGWTGIGEFFETNQHLFCAFSESNIKITKGSAILPKEDVQYVVNGKVCLLNIMGNNQSGYLYEIEWYDDSFRSKLECATQHFSELTKEAVIALAKEIDAR